MSFSPRKKIASKALITLSVTASILDEILEFDAASIDGVRGLEESNKLCPLYIGFNNKGEVTGSRACEPKPQGFIQNLFNSIIEVF